MPTQPLSRPVATADDLLAGVGPLTVLYDDDCGVCRETVRQLRRWDRVNRFEFMPLGRAASSGRPLLVQLAAEGHLGDAIHVVDESSGRIVTGGHAALAILDGLPGGWLLRPWAALPPTGVAADVVYRVASRHRHRVAWLMGMRDEVSCPVATTVTQPPTSRPPRSQPIRRAGGTVSSPRE